MNAVEPDFDQIARTIVERWGIRDVPYATSVLMADLADELRLVWNARGDADLEALAPVLGVNMDAEWDAIEKLDH